MIGTFSPLRNCELFGLTTLYKCSGRQHVGIRTAMLILQLLLMVLITQAEKPYCIPQGHRVLPEMVKDGDLIIGGIFSFRTGQDGYTDSFTKMPEIRPCKEYVCVSTMDSFYLFICLHLLLLCCILFRKIYSMPD